MTRKSLPDYPTPPKALLSSYDPPSLGGSKMADDFLQPPPPFISCWLRLIHHENHVFPQENPPLIKNNLSSKIQSMLISQNQC